jgi:DNA-binding MarR family transcriptional regulator
MSPSQVVKDLTTTEADRLTIVKRLTNTYAVVMTTTTTTAVASSGLPLVAVLSRLEAAFTAEFDRRLRESEFCSLSLAHSRNVLRHLDDGPLRHGRLGELAGVSKQAISQQVAHLQRDGLVEVTGDAVDQRAKVVALTERGRRARCLVVATFAEIERDWEGLLGADELPAARRSLAELLDQVVRDGDLTPPPSC